MNGNQVIFEVFVKPRSRSNSFNIEDDGSIVISIKKPATKGKANKALIKYLAGLFDVPSGSISIIRGATSRDKTISMRGIIQSEFNKRLLALKEGRA